MFCGIPDDFDHVVMVTGYGDEDSVIFEVLCESVRLCSSLCPLWSDATDMVPWCVACRV